MLCCSSLLGSLILEADLRPLLALAQVEGSLHQASTSEVLTKPSQVPPALLQSKSPSQSRAVRVVQGLWVHERAA